MPAMLEPYLSELNLIAGDMTSSAGGLILLLLLTAFAESLAVVGLLVPGIAILIGLTVIAPELGISPWTWWLVGTIGAFLGDGTSFWLGRRAQGRLHHWHFFQRHPDWLAHSHEFFTRYGVWSIAFGRFIGPLRPLVPVVAGASAMPTSSFLLANTLSSPAWAAAYLLPIYWLGERAALHFSRASVVLLVMGGFVLAVLFMLWLKRRRF
ncbi:DedA family protein [Thalassolituus oleivorans]|uniref:DedA family protein n=1 Tax=Thalassolituus oleivorans TaxID=187493 RepID=UPI00240952A1|nr:DedA family protein [Thalassolituus oleivorans]MDF1640315.1 DedA family protein [Thalassolituus oleivorans]